MTLVVIAPFHLGGVQKQVGDILTADEAKIVDADVELSKRVTRRGGDPVSSWKSPASSVAPSDLS